MKHHTYPEKWRRIWITTRCSWVPVRLRRLLHLPPNRLRYILGGILLHYSSFVFRIRHTIHSVESRLWVRHIHTGIRATSEYFSRKSRIQVFRRHDRWKMGIYIWGRSTNIVAVLICGCRRRCDNVDAFRHFFLKICK